MADQTPTNPKTESQEPTITSNDNSSIIDITPPSEIKTKEELTPPLQAYFKLWKYSYPLDALLRVLGAIVAFGAGTAAPLMTILFGNLVNKFNGFALGRISAGEFRGSINRYALFFVWLFLGKFVLVYIAALMYGFTGARIARRIRFEYLQTVLRQPIQFFDSHSPGAIANSLSTDTNVIEIGLGEKVATTIEAVGQIVTGFVIAFCKSWRMTLVIGTMIPYIMITTGALFGAITKVEAQTRTVLRMASELVEEALSGVVNVVALGAGEKIVERYRKPVGVAAGLGLKRGPLEATLYGNMFFSTFNVYALALFYGGKLVVKGEIGSGGTVMTVIFAMLIASNSFGMMAPNIPVLIKAAASAQQMLKLLSQSSNSPQDSKHLDLKPKTIDGHLKIENLSFCYPARPTVTVLDNVSFEVKPRKVTAVVGHSGSGKSTLMGLLERWYEPGEGNILLDGVDIKDLDVEWWRGQIGLVQQEPMLFNDTIFENVLNGYHGGDTSHLSDAEKSDLVIKACKSANAHTFITSLPMGYHTPLGERADTLSGGQKQRIAIARAIISDPPILLLDEATSALDAESEKAVQDALDKASKDRTTFVIAHKMSTVQNADKILVMDEGKLVEGGTHEELVAKKGSYYRLLHSQTGLDKPEKSESSPSIQLAPDQNAEDEKGKRTSEAQGRKEEIPASLTDPEISNKHGILYCIKTMLFTNPATLPSFIAGSLICIIAAAAFPLNAYLFSKLATIFQLSGSRLLSRANFWALMFFILALSNLFSYAILWFLFAISGQKMSLTYQPLYLKSVLEQRMSFFFREGHESGALTSLIAEDGEELTQFIAMSVGLLIVFALDLIMCCVLAIAINWKLGLVGVLGCIPVLMGSGFVRIRLEFEAADRCGRFFLESARFGAEAVEMIKTVVSLGMQGQVADRFKGRLREAVLQEGRTLSRKMIFFAGCDSIDLLAAGLTFWYGGRLVSYGELSTQKYFIIYTAIIMGGQSAGFIFGYSSNINKARLAANRILYLSSKSQSPPPTPLSTLTPSIEPKSKADTEPLIQFQNVNFAYPSRPHIPVLKNVTLHLQPGENLILTGPSGCGKSSLLSLIERFYHINSGVVRMDGRDVNEMSVEETRNKLALVTQDSWLVGGSLRENLLLGVGSRDLLPDGGEEEVMQKVCKDIGLGEWIEGLPDGYGTEVGGRGNRVSGGQRQRVCIARAVLRLLLSGGGDGEKGKRGEGKVILLDEATSALDRESEKCVVNALERLVREEGVSVLHVSHQEEVIRRADRVVYLEGGRVVENGKWC